MVIVNIIKYYYYILLSLLLLYIIIPLYYIYIYIYIHQLYFPSELWITKWHLHFLPSILANSWVISAVSRSQAGWYLISSQKRPVREDVFAKLPLLKCPCELYKGSTTLVNIRVRTQTTLHLPTHTKKQVQQLGKNRDKISWSLTSPFNFVQTIWDTDSQSTFPWFGAPGTATGRSSFHDIYIKYFLKEMEKSFRIHKLIMASLHLMWVVLFLRLYDTNASTI